MWYQMVALDECCQWKCHECGCMNFLKNAFRLQTLREKCPNTEFLLVRIQENMD